VASPDALGTVELAIRTALHKLGAGLLEGLLSHDRGHRGPSIDCGGGHQARFVGYRDKTIDTVLGALTLSRAYYHCPSCHRGIVPKDDQLGITDASLSPGLRAMVARVGANMPFAQATGLLAELAGLTLTVKRVEEPPKPTEPEPPPRSTPRPTPSTPPGSTRCHHRARCPTCSTSPSMAPGSR